MNRETAEAPQENDHWECNCVPHLGAPHCHRCGDLAGHPVAWEDSIHATKEAESE